MKKNSPALLPTLSIFVKILGCIVLHSFLIAQSLDYSSKTTKIKLDHSFLNMIGDSLEGQQESMQKRMLLFVINFADFNCTPCLNNFLDFSDSLRANLGRYGKTRIVLVFQRDTTQMSAQHVLLQKWLRTLRIEFPFHIFDSSVLTENGLNPSGVLLVQGDGVTLGSHFPISNKDKESILNLLFHR